MAYMIFKKNAKGIRQKGFLNINPPHTHTHTHCKTRKNNTVLIFSVVRYSPKVKSGVKGVNFSVLPHSVHHSQVNGALVFYSFAICLNPTFLLSWERHSNVFRTYTQWWLRSCIKFDCITTYDITLYMCICVTCDIFH